MLVSGGTDNHLVLLDLKPSSIDGARVQQVPSCLFLPVPPPVHHHVCCRHPVPGSGSIQPLLTCKNPGLGHNRAAS